MSYNGIDKVHLYQLCKDKGEYGIGASSIPKSDVFPTYIRITDISDNGNLITEGLTSVDHSDSSKYYLKENDIVFARTGASTGRAFFYEKKYGELVYAGFLIKFSLDEKKVNPKYLKYYCLSEQYKGWVKAFTGGSTRGNINAKTFSDMIVELPNRKQQDYLVKILSSLDDKIELNNKIIKNLEELAQTLYKRWFVDFEYPNQDGEPYKSSGGEMVESEFGLIPKEWAIDTIGNLIDCITEATKPGIHLLGRRYVPIDTLQSKKLTFSDYKSFSEANSSLILFEKMDILIGAMRVYFHKVNLSFYPGITRTTTFVLRSKSELEVPFNLLTLNQDSAIDYANGTSKGSTMPYAVWQNAFDKYKVINPGFDVKKSFYDLIMPNLELINTYNAQNAKLERLRDELLPKLMNGEIEVPIEE